MRMKKLMILAAIAATAISCVKTYVEEAEVQTPIGFATWNDHMTKQSETKAAKTDFAENDEFDIFGFKWNAGPSNQTTVFDGVDVKYDGSNWNYSPLRFWDSHFDNYTFFASYPKDQLATAPAQTGLFVSNSLAYDGVNEKLLIAQKNTVAKASYGAIVPMVFNHTAALVDIKVKKHTDIASAKVIVNNIHIGNVKTTGTYTVASYNGDNNPVGATVSGTEGLGWTPTETVNSDAAPYAKTAATTLGYNVGAGTANAADLIPGLIVMPQQLGTASGPTITINYSIVAGSIVDEADVDVETITFAPEAFYIGGFDITDNEDQNGTKIPAWMPGVHYTYYITINANVITFSATIAEWNPYDDGHYYLING